MLISVAQHVTYCISAGVYRSPAAVYVQVMPQLEKALTSDPKVYTLYTNVNVHSTALLVSGIASHGPTQVQAWTIYFCTRVQ